MISKSKIAFVAAIAVMSIVSPALAYSVSSNDGSIASQSGLSNGPTITQDETVAVRQGGLNAFASIHGTQSGGESGYDPSIRTQR